jgi:hypothetical protein
MGEEAPIPRLVNFAQGMRFEAGAQLFGGVLLVERLERMLRGAPSQACIADGSAWRIWIAG